ncbi:MAG: hypothetical protein KAT65_22690, partial [Methanophagales archaeon]|nr:hypothetical protein [Methanophagales archaeon]
MIFIFSPLSSLYLFYEKIEDSQRKFQEGLFHSMCLGETGNNQGDSFLYDGKISKSKRKLFEGGINALTGSFLRAKHIPSTYCFFGKAFFLKERFFINP